MPIYEYVCPKCKSKFELLRPMAQADDEALCPECKSKGKRVFSRFACFSADESGLTSSIGGSPCSGCSSSDCSSCGG